jgi:hypothetical protein
MNRHARYRALLNNNNNNNNNDACLQSVETSDESSVSSTYEDSSSVSSSWTDSDDSSSNSSFDYKQLEIDVSNILSASKRLTRHETTNGASQLLENASSATMRKCVSHHNFIGHMANQSIGNDNSAAVDLLAEDAATPTRMQKSKSFSNLKSSGLTCHADRGGIDTDDEGMMASIREDLLMLGTLLASRKGDAFRERALVLASINYLARNVPCCVLDHLGREVRQAEHRSLFQDQHTPSTASCCSSSSMSSSPTDGWNMIDDDSKITGYRTLTRIQSLDAQTEGMILDLPFVAPFQGVVLLGKPTERSSNNRIIESSWLVLIYILFSS